MGASNSRTSNRSQAQRERERRREQRATNHYSNHQHHARGHFPGARHPAAAHRGGYPGAMRVQMTPHGHHHPRPPPEPVVQAPEVQVTKSIKNEASLDKTSVKCTRAPDGTCTLSFDLAATSAGVVRVWTATTETLREGVLTHTPADPAADVIETPYAAQAAEGETQTMSVAIPSGRLPAGSAAEGNKYPVIVSLWYKVALADSEIDQAYLCYFETGEDEAPRAEGGDGGEGGAAATSDAATPTTATVTLKLARETLWAAKELYLLEPIYGMAAEGSPSPPSPDGAGGGVVPAELAALVDDAADTTCVICMTDDRDTTVMPCRHMCLCYDCAAELRKATNKCPICRTAITGLLKREVAAASSEPPPPAPVGSSPPLMPDASPADLDADTAPLVVD